MLVFALVAHRMTTLVEFVSRGYDDAKSAAQNLQGRATYEKQVGNACARARTGGHTLSSLARLVLRGRGSGHPSDPLSLLLRSLARRQVDGLFLSDRVGPFVCECMKGGPYISLVVGTTSSKAEERRDCLLDIR